MNAENVTELLASVISGLRRELDDATTMLSGVRVAVRSSYGLDSPGFKS